jgi:hypothetical protein
MNKTDQVKYDAAIVMAQTANAKADKLQAEKDAKEDTRPFEAIAERIDGTNKFLLVIPSMNFSAQLLLRRDKNTLVATKEYVHSEEETNSNEAVREVFVRKARYDALATQKNVASQGDVPSAS